MMAKKVDLSHPSYMNPHFNRIWWWTGELWWPHSNLMWWMSWRQRVCGLSQNRHCFSWELEKNEKNKQEITFSLLKTIKDRKWKQLSLKRDYWCNGECEWRALTSTSTTLGCVKKTGKFCNCNLFLLNLSWFMTFCSIVIFSMFYDSWLFALNLVQSCSKFSTQGKSVNCGGHKADSCADCPLVWRNLHFLDDYWLFIKSIHF